MYLIDAIDDFIHTPLFLLVFYVIDIDLFIPICIFLGLLTGSWINFILLLLITQSWIAGWHFRRWIRAKRIFKKTQGRPEDRAFGSVESYAQIERERLKNKKI